VGKRGKRKKQQLKDARRKARRYKSTNQLMLKLSVVAIVISGIGVLIDGSQFLLGDNLVGRLTQPTQTELAEVRKEPPVSRIRSTPPYVKIISPANNSTFSYDSSVTISARATSRDSKIAAVAFHAGNRLIGSESGPSL